MALTTVEYTYSGQASFAIPFSLGILNRAYVTIQINNQVDGSGDPLYYTNFTWTSDSEVVINGLTNGDIIKIARTIPSNLLLSDYTAGSNITRDNLNIANKQLIMLIHEVLDKNVTQQTKLDTIESGATADQTAAEIKTAYESNANTNAFTDADESKLDGIEAGADVTDTANVTAAGAVMDSEVSDLAGIKSVNVSTLQVKPAEGAFVDGDKTKLNSIETNADVTDTTNVVAALTAGTNITIASDGTIASTAAGGGGGGVSDIVEDLTPQLGGDLDLNNQDITGTGNISITGTVNTRDMSVDGAKLDGIEAGATADQTKADIDALNIDADTLDGQHGSYYTSYADTAVAGIVDSAPGTLDTLNELAQALGDDPNFATTTATNLSQKLPKAGGTMTGDILFNDGVKAKYGTSSDLQIFHDGSNSYITDSGTGILFLRTNQLQIQSDDGLETYGVFTDNGAVNLYHNNIEKFATTSTGIDVTGGIDATGTISSGAMVIENSGGYGNIEIGGGSGAYIDLKAPFSDDYDFRIITVGTSTVMNGESGNLILQRAGSSKLTVTTSGIDVTGAIDVATSGASNTSKGLAIATSGTNFESDGGIISIDHAASGAVTGGYFSKYSAGGTLRHSVKGDGTGYFAGAFGVGHTSPVAKMAILGTSNSTITEANSNLCVEGSGGNGMLFGTLSTTGFKSYIQSGYVSSLSTATYDLLLNPEGGNVGIGTTSPNHELHIESTSPTIRLVDTDANNTVDFSQSGSALYIDFDNNVRFRNLANVERLRIDSGGIDVTGVTKTTGSGYNPSNTGWATNASLITSGSYGGGLTFLDGSAGYSIRVENSGADLVIGQGATSGALTQKVKINSSGLDVTGSITSDALTVDTTASNGVTINAHDNATTTYPLKVSNAAGSGNLELGTYGINNNIDLKLQRGGSTKLTVTSSGIDVNGNLDVSNALYVGGANATNSGFIESTVVGPSRALQTVGNVNTTQTHIGFENLSGEIGRIDVSAFSVAYVTSSDYRLKTDIKPMQGSIDRVKALKPVNFEWTGDGTRVDGFIAHEAQEVVPEAVSGEKDATKTNKDGVEVPDYQGIDQSKLVPLLTSALQEALAKIDDLELRMANLEN